MTLSKALSAEEAREQDKAKHRAYRKRKGLRFMKRREGAERRRRELSIEVEALYYDRFVPTFPDERRTAEDFIEDFEFGRRLAARDRPEKIRPGQVWKRLDESIRIVRLLVEPSGRGGHFDVVAEFEDEPGLTFVINADRIHLYWHLDRSGVLEGQLELWA